MSDRSYYDWIFEFCWRCAAEAGLCDECGSAEFIRLRELWRAAGHPHPVPPWIRDHANRPPASADNGQA